MMISLVIATKDRPSDLRNLLSSLSAQPFGPEELIIVDASANPVEHVVREFSSLRIKYVKHWPPSAAAQRNVGMKASDPRNSLIGFVDDDIIFEPDAFEAMRSFWQQAQPDILGAAFNLLNYPDRGKARLKHSPIVEKWGLYSRRPGAVAKSGWQTVIPKLEQTQFVEWLPTCAVLFRRSSLTAIQFDEFFESYSYLEDLDISFSIAKAGRLVVVAGAGYSHFPSTQGRIGMFQFGKYEIRNRLYLVRKHKLSQRLCYVGLFVRAAMTMWACVSIPTRSNIERLWGNVYGLLRFALFPQRPLAKPVPLVHKRAKAL